MHRIGRGHIDGATDNRIYTVASMNSQSENNMEPDTDRRTEPRQESVARCGLWAFGEVRHKEGIADVLVRNSSFSGVSIIAKLVRPMRIRGLILLQRCVTGKAR